MTAGRDLLQVCICRLSRLKDEAHFFRTKIILEQSLFTSWFSVLDFQDIAQTAPGCALICRLRRSSSRLDKAHKRWHCPTDYPRHFLCHHAFYFFWNQSDVAFINSGKSCVLWLAVARVFVFWLFLATAAIFFRYSVLSFWCEKPNSFSHLIKFYLKQSKQSW